MLIAIRVDASLKMGTGHVYRTRTLAHQLQRRGHQVIFICRRLAGNLIAMLENDFEVLVLPKPQAEFTANHHCAHGDWLEVEYATEIAQTQSTIADYLHQRALDKIDWLIADHYAIDKWFHRAVRDQARFVMQIDDLADRSHEVDVLLDQNYYQQGHHRYDEILPAKARRLCGPRYALLRHEFFTASEGLTPYKRRLKNNKVVIFFGGIDIDNETSKALSGLLSVQSRDRFDVIIGLNNPHRNELEDLCQRHRDRVSLHVQVTNMVEFLANAYLYVGAVGATTWERCAVGLPAIVCSVANNQQQLASDLNEINGHFYLGQHQQLSANDYAQAYVTCLQHPHRLAEQATACQQLVDGKGGRRVIEHLEAMMING